jgi:hypothetical protein
MDTGQTYNVSVSLTNDGNFTWPSGGASPVHLAYHWYTSEGYLVQWDGERSLLSTDVAPGGSTTVSASVTALGEAGSYILKWDLVQEGVTWFGNAGCDTMDVAVEVAA